MSRAFEILDRVQQERELFRVPPITRAEPAHYEIVRPEVTRDDWPAFAREQLLKLVQTAFLTTDAGHTTLPRRVVFCGIDNDEGSRQLCGRLARVLAEQVSSAVCVVDSNLRTASAQPLFDSAIFDPLASSPLSEGSAKRGPTRMITDNLFLASHDSLPGDGKPSLDEVRAWIKDLSERFPYLVISAPPLGLYRDAVMLGQMADGVVLVLEANSTRRVTAQKSKQALDEADVRVLGTVLNNRTFPIPEKLYRKL